jgi:hypothetical protein
MKHRKKLSVAVLLFLACLSLSIYGRSLWHPIYVFVVGGRTVQEAVDQFQKNAESRLRPHFHTAQINFPPQELTLIGLKEEKQLELWAKNDEGWKLIHTYPILAASGSAGPKLREGDRQVPEGMYRIAGLNPNSSYHLSMKLNYPNRIDRHYAELEGRTEPGSNIFIQGKDLSIGCLAMGDSAIEELFVLVHLVGMQNVNILIAPHDVRKRSLFPVPESLPKWTTKLYESIETEFKSYDKSAQGVQIDFVSSADDSVLGNRRAFSRTYGATNRPR